METSGITIRTATGADADAVFRMAGKLATSETPESVAFTSSLSAVLADPLQQLLVAVADDAPVGYLLGLVHPAFHVNGQVAWVEELWVDEPFRGLRVGRALMDAFEDWARTGARYVALATRRAGDFYRAIGYEESAGFFKKRLEYGAAGSDAGR